LKFLPDWDPQHGTTAKLNCVSGHGIPPTHKLRVEQGPYVGVLLLTINNAWEMVFNPALLQKHCQWTLSLPLWWNCKF